MVIAGPFLEANGDASLQLDFAVVIGALHLGDIGKEHAFALAVDSLAGGVIQAQHDILRGNNRWLAISREQHVVGREHERASFELSLQ